MRLRTANADGPRSVGMTCTPRQYADPTSLKSPPLLILWKAQAAGARDRPAQSTTEISSCQISDTRGSVIVGVCQQDPERWREFDAIYRPMLFAFLRKQGLKESEANDVVQDIFVKLLGKIQTYDRDEMQVPELALQRRAQHADRPGPAAGQQQKAIDGWVANMLHASASDSLKMAEEWVKHPSHEDPGITRWKRVRSRTSPKSWACFEQRLLRDRPGAEIAAELGIEPGDRLRERQPRPETSPCRLPGIRRGPDR